MVNLNEVISDGIKPKKAWKECQVKEFNMPRIPRCLISSEYDAETKSPADKSGRNIRPTQVMPPSDWYG